MHSFENRSKYNKEQQDYFIKLFSKAMNNQKYIKINNNFFITVDFIDIEKSDCHRCKIPYDSIVLSGKIYTHETDYKIAHKYNTSISSFDVMCECFGFTENEMPELLFKCLIERKKHYIYDYYINKNNVKIVDYIDSIDCEIE